MRRFKLWQIIVMIVAVLAIIVALGFKFGWWTSAWDALFGDKETETVTESDLSINLDDVSGYFKNVSWEFLDTQMANRDAERTKAAGFSDAVSFPFSSDNKDEMFKELEEEILRSPVYADMVIRGLKDIKVSDKTIGELNPWMGDFLKKTDAAYVLGTDVHPRGIEIWLARSKEVTDTKIYVSKEFRNYAVYTCVLLERLENLGVKEWESVKNYNLPFVALNSSRRTQLADYQESKKVLVLQYVNKKGDVLFTIGFNIFDKRFEIVKPPEKKTAETTGTPSTPPVQPKGDTPKTPSEPTKPTKPDTPETTTPKKDTSKDPAVQQPPNVDGGKVKEKDDKGPGTYQPEQPKKSTTGPIYVAPETTQPATVDKTPETTTPETTAPAAEPAHKEKSEYTDNSGETIIIDDDDVFDGKIVMPD